MVAIASPFPEYDRYEGLAHFEKITRRRDGRMPVRSAGSAIRGAHRTSGTGRAKRRASQPHSGKQHRRHRQIGKVSLWARSAS